MVIALVMLQPGCQSAKKSTLPDLNASATVEPDPLNSFNRGSDTKTIDDPKPKDEFVTPTRPKPGEIIIPGETVPPVPVEVDPIAGNDTGNEVETIIPTDRTVYKIQRGDTLWGVARKNQISLSNLLSANPKITQTSKLSIGQEILIPSSVSNVPQEQTPVASPVGNGNYVVKPGDNLSKIAKQNGVSLADLMNINQLNSSSIIRPGQSLIIPESVGLNNLSPVIDSNPVPAGATTHTVKKGENLTKISSIYGASVKQIMEWNGLADAGLIRVGQNLIVSTSTASENDPVPANPVQVPTPEAAPTTNESLENFFKGNTENRPVVVEPAENP